LKALCGHSIIPHHTPVNLRYNQGHAQWNILYKTSINYSFKAGQHKICTEPCTVCLYQYVCYWFHWSFMGIMSLVSIILH